MKRRGFRGILRNKSWLRWQLMEERVKRRRKKERGREISIVKRVKVRLSALPCLPLTPLSLSTEKISLSLSKRPTLPDRSLLNGESSNSMNKRQKTLPFDDNSLDATSTVPSHSSSASTSNTAPPKSAIQLLMEEEEQRKLSLSLQKTKQNQMQYQDQRRAERGREVDEEEEERGGEEEVDSTSPSWLHRQIIVKIMNKRLGNGRYYKAKGVIEDITGEGFVAIIRLLIESDTGEVSHERIKVDQEELETVIPQVRLSLTDSLTITYLVVGW
jgi:hypothetical protein